MIKQIKITQQEAFDVSLNISVDIPLFSVDITASNAVSYNSIILRSILNRVEADGGTIGSESCLESVLEELDGTAPSSITGLLNISGMESASATYSLILERNNYFGACIKAQRSSDNATLDIYFTDSGNIDSTALINFSNGGDVLVQTWFDQGINGNHAKQTDPTLMPFIVKSGSYLGYVENQTINTGDSLMSSFKYDTSQNFATLAVLEVTGNAVVFGTDDSSQYQTVAQSGNSLDPHTSDFTSMSYFVNKVELTSPDRQDVYSALLGTFSLIRSTGISSNSRKLQIGYGAIPSFNNSKYKAVVVFSGVPANISDAEDELTTKYSL